MEQTTGAVLLEILVLREMVIVTLTVTVKEILSVDLITVHGEIEMTVVKKVNNICKKLLTLA